MLGLLTWPCYGTWLTPPARGWIDRGAAAPPVAEPGRAAGRGERLTWPPVRLDGAQRAVVIRDLRRVAGFRSFELHAVAVAADHVHALLSIEPGRDVPRLVQLVKGAASRALTVAAGDGAPRGDPGAALPHHKWWSRQYSFAAVEDRRALEAVLGVFEAHEAAGAAVWRAPGSPIMAP